MSWTVDGLEYTTRKKLTIDQTKIDTADLANFPVLVKLTDDADIGVGANADGFDIRFTEADGETLCKYERESWAVAGDVANACFWVKIPLVDYDADTDFYIYYRTTDTADGADPTNVWDANFKAVYHLKDITTSTVDDSTTINDGTKKGANEPIEAAGKIGKAQTFDGSDDYISMGDVLDLNYPLTLEAWVKSSDFTQGSNVFIAKQAGVGGGWRGYVLYLYSTDGKARMSIVTTTGDVDIKSDAALSNDNWHHVVGVYDGTNVYLYVDGASAATPVAFNKTLDQWGDNLYLGRRDDGLYFAGLIDESRISNSVRSAPWIKASYNSGNDSLLTYGDEEEPAAGPANVKSVNGVAIASVKSINGVAIADVKSVNGIT